jgi:sugar lactone lactonase YvrE
MIFDNRPCDLGEGPMWHPLRNQLFWFDITGQRMLSVEKGAQRQWRFPEMVSAAGWVDRDIMLIAGERDLFLFDVETEEVQTLTELEADNRATRSNDGRADPQGGFWIGTMGKKAEVGAGAIYRYHRGELRKLFPGITIPNAICFTPDGRTAHFTDTVTGRVMRVALDADGWPMGQPEVYLDLTAHGLDPDGAVIDATGLMWLAKWGAARVAAYDPGGQMVREVGFDAPHTSCPAFGGPGLTTLFCTTALQGMDEAARAAHPHAGMTFAAEGIASGQAEHRVQP